MSEQDVDVLGSDSQLGANIDRDRRAPRFSWTPAYEATFFRSLCESVQLGLRENSSFKAEAWERAALALQESHGACPTKNHLINKSDNARKRFRLWRGLRENPDFAYSPVTRVVSALEGAWAAHIEREPLARALRGRPFEHEEYMEILYPDVIGSGGAPKRIMKPRRRTDGQVGDESDMPGTGVMNLQNELTPPHAPRSSVESSMPSRPSLSATPSGSSSGSIPQQPSTTTIPPRGHSRGNQSILTPPDESLSYQKPYHASKPSLVGQPTFAPTPESPASMSAPSHLSAAPGKRRRTSSRDASVTKTSAPILNSAAPMSRVAQAPQMSHLEAAVMEHRPLVEELVDALTARATPKWREDALDLFFHEFAAEELDLQVKISENILCHETKAMIFCKMPGQVRRHWVSRLRELHHKAALG